MVVNVSKYLDFDTKSPNTLLPKKGAAKNIPLFISNIGYG